MQLLCLLGPGLDGFLNFRIRKDEISHVILGITQFMKRDKAPRVSVRFLERVFQAVFAHVRLNDAQDLFLAVMIRFAIGQR